MSFVRFARRNCDTYCYNFCRLQWYRQARSFLTSSCVPYSNTMAPAHLSEAGKSGMPKVSSISKENYRSNKLSSLNHTSIMGEHPVIQTSPTWARVASHCYDRKLSARVADCCQTHLSLYHENTLNVQTRASGSIVSKRCSTRGISVLQLNAQCIYFKKVGIETGLERWIGSSQGATEKALLDLENVSHLILAPREQNIQTW